MASWAINGMQARKVLVSLEAKLDEIVSGIKSVLDIGGVPYFQFSQKSI